MVGNSLKSDVLPMLAAGGWGVHVPHAMTWALERADPPQNHSRFHQMADLSHLADLSRFRIERRRWLGQWRYYYTVPYGPYYIWGATARILRGLAERVAR